MIRVHVERRDYGNELAIWVLAEFPGQPVQVGVVDSTSCISFVGAMPEDGTLPQPTLRLHGRMVDDFFAGLEGYRDRNETAEAVLAAALDDTREVRDRLLTMLEDA